MFIPSGKERILSATSKNKTRTKKKNMKAKEKGHKTTTVINYTRKVLLRNSSFKFAEEYNPPRGPYIYMNFATEFPS